MEEELLSVASAFSTTLHMAVGAFSDTVKAEQLPYDTATAALEKVCLPCLHYTIFKIVHVLAAQVMHQKLHRCSGLLSQDAATASAKLQDALRGLMYVVMLTSLDPKLLSR